MYGLDLFSGIGGISKALEGYVTPIAYCETDRYCQGVLLSQMFRAELPEAPIWDDVTTLQPIDLPVKPDIIYGGFPCQDISAAGRGCRQEHTNAGGAGEGTTATQERRGSANSYRWEAEPNVDRVAHGVPLRIDRLRALGNAVVPAQAREAFERLMGLK